jgi:segregation and condensation protein B
MSLKAKLEAVIYAAEEPVTLAQLSALFAADALEWKAQQEAASAATAAEPTPQEPLPLLNQTFDYLELEQGSEPQVETGAGPAEPTAEAAVEPVSEPSEVVGAPEAGPEAEAAEAPSVEGAPEVAPDPEAEAKRLARQQDREVRAILRGLLDELIATYASDDRGIEIKEIAGGYRMATKPECHDAARMFVKSLKPALKLSLPALETLAVIAYKQPVTAPEVNEIRGVDSSGVFGSLLARKLIATAGRKQVIGRPILYKTTREFLLRFGLKDVTELPSMEEFEKIAQLEFEDMATAAEGEAAAAVDEDSRLEVDGDGDEPSEEAPAEESVQETTTEGAKTESPVQENTEKETNETAAMADSEEVPEIEQPDTTEAPAEPLESSEPSAIEADTTTAEAAPAAPSPLEQAETETVPHD